MARVPTIAEEDAKRPNRERDCLVGERTRIVNRIKSTLARLGRLSTRRRIYNCNLRTVREVREFAATSAKLQGRSRGLCSLTRSS
jgi:transposase